MTTIEKAISNETETETSPKTRKQRLWNVGKTILKITVTTALLIWVFSKVDVNSIKFRLLHPKYWFMYVAGIACFFLSVVISAWRLLSFFKSIGLKLDPKYNLRLYFLG